MSKSWENRFRDPAFVTIWERWQQAKDAWRTTRLCVDMREGGADLLYNPDPATITNPYFRAVAHEFQEARKAYHVEIKSRSDEEGEDGAHV